MPVHWYYNPSDIVNQYGKVTDFLAPSDEHPSSIMSLHSTGKGGRGDQKGSVVGDVILHDKKQFWGSSNVHYHRGMHAGENTLNLQCLRVLIRCIVANEGKYDSDKFLEDYIAFMTTKGTHNDTYAESYHRDFFANWADGKTPRECAGDEGHDTPSIGGFVTLPAVILLHFNDREKAREAAVEHMLLTHKSNSLAEYARAYSDLLLDVLHCEEEIPSKKTLQTLVTAAAEGVGIKNFGRFFEKDVPDTFFIGRVVSSACYIDHSFPSLMFLVGKYGDSLEQCLIVNTNAGGENCHRGAAVGTVIGAAQGYGNIPRRWIEGLYARAELEKEIDGFVEAVMAQTHSESKSSA